jgi:DNA-directed RNA polymerase specialized sigma24 family protein
MTRKRCTGKALAERRRRTFQLYLAEFTQEEIADKVGVHRSVVSRDLQSVRDSACPGNPPMFRRRASPRWQK